MIIESSLWGGIFVTAVILIIMIILCSVSVPYKGIRSTAFPGTEPEVDQVTAVVEDLL